MDRASLGEAAASVAAPRTAAQAASLDIMVMIVSDGATAIAARQGARPPGARVGTFRDCSVAVGRKEVQRAQP